MGHESYFDKMTHFDFKTLLPALLQVEDRVSMAHGLESRVPLLDHELVELAATMPADVKFKDGTMKHVFKQATRSLVPDVIADRKDKMGFPVPLHEWFAGPAREFVSDVFSSQAALEPRALRQPQGARRAREGEPLRPPDLGPAIPRTVAAAVPRPRARVQEPANDERHAK